MTVLLTGRATDRRYPQPRPAPRRHDRVAQGRGQHRFAGACGLGLAEGFSGDAEPLGDVEPVAQQRTKVEGLASYQGRVLRSYLGQVQDEACLRLRGRMGRVWKRRAWEWNVLSSAELLNSLRVCDAVFVTAATLSGPSPADIVPFPGELRDVVVAGEDVVEHPAVEPADVPD